MSQELNSKTDKMGVDLDGEHDGFICFITHRIHGAAIYGNMDPINIPQMLAYIPYMDPMGYVLILAGKYSKD